jgi:LuxR family maltose regulon positive regulatory protein
VSVVAPAGYGKTTLLGQWAARDGRPFAFLTLDTPGTDAATLVARIEAATATLAAEPFVLVIDDAHLLSADAAATVTMLVRHLPAGATIALAAQHEPLPSIPRLRASGAVLELGRDDLALTAREARLLIRRNGVTMAADRVDRLVRTLGGWPAGVDAAATSLRERDHSVLHDLRESILAMRTREERDFLRRTSILDRLSAPLCDALLERHDSALRLESLEPSLLLVSLDRTGGWFRQHGAFRELLRAELGEREPELVPLLERRATDWLEASGDPESALLHARAAGDVGRIAVILDTVAIPMHNNGRDAALLAWIAGLDEATELAGHPRLATLAARLHAQRGNAPEAERWLAKAEPRSPRRRRANDVAASVALVRAAMCQTGVESMLADVESALDVLPADDRWRPYGLLLQGSAYMLLGDADRGDAILSRAARAAERRGSTESRVVALTERSLLANARGERAEADALLALALASMVEGGLHTYPTCALTLAVSARSQLLHGHISEAASALADARRLSEGLTRALPWLAVQCRLELARAYVTLRDAAAARWILRETDELLSHCPDLGVLRAQRDGVEDELRARPATGNGRATSLTVAELRLLPMLATHLSFREIAQHFFLSRNTVKTQAISVYRKLGASNRSEAVGRAHHLGLIEPAADSTSLILTG